MALWNEGTHLCVDADSGLVHTDIGTAAQVSEVKQAGARLPRRID